MTRYVASLAVVLVIVGISVRAGQQPVADGRADAPLLEANRALARQQLALVDGALEIQRALAKQGQLPVNDPSFALWERRKIEALRKSGAGKPEMIAAMEALIKTLKGDEATAKAMKEQGRGTEAGVVDAQFRLIEAQILLNEEKAR